jgi:hypothetical protein
MGGKTTTILNWMFSGTLAYYVLWILFHYGAAHAYTYFCTPLTWQGFLTSPFLVPAPHCTALRWVISEGSNVVLGMWSIGGTFLIAQLLRKND